MNNSKLSERFIFCYSKRKMNYLRDRGFRYLFKCIHKVNQRPFWVFDKTDEVSIALTEYKRPDEENN